ncbi:HAD-like domain-containing protein [Cokeromyces recurvatus]|uniref:HAD-like domain-containing protein n=1 Tax=Cokeromyces recurvatus TaxID=90255 RepID=UPI0022210B74|nr:HAD-like domain-containing protein [Cokeromyces recurvatus]KAI7905761.1 HAD-like domain-containing protein [Cokeromyces recurvatus]
MPFVAFDLQGTLFTFNKVIDKIQETLKNTKVPDIITSSQQQQTAKRFFEYWYYSALCEYIACSQAGTYESLRNVMNATLARAFVCYFDVNEIETILDEPSRWIDSIMQAAFDDMELAVDAIEALNLLLKENEGREYGWDIWILSSYSGLKETIELLKRTGLSAFIEEENIISCDDLKISKPHPKVYSELMRTAVHKTKRIESFYLIGSHAYDLAGAKNMSLKTVFLNTTEKIYIRPLYDDHHKPDLIGSNLVDCVKKMMEYENMKKHGVV